MYVIQKPNIQIPTSDTPRNLLYFHKKGCNSSESNPHLNPFSFKNIYLSIMSILEITKQKSL